MLRLSRLTDYGIVLMAHFATRDAGMVVTARELAELSHIPLPTVSKVLKSLNKSELLSSQRGVNGGYVMNKKAQNISVMDMIEALEGAVELTPCSNREEGACEFEKECLVRNPWKAINQVVYSALSKFTLEDMVKNRTGASL